ncbi:hypothetical protein FQN53_003593 [Emmonsiellopsis sp. PD_33]|nr:hypothetical protein FQN53_003593 [Emmonsiellopsis sp. PD_33]
MSGSLVFEKGPPDVKSSETEAAESSVESGAEKGDSHLLSLNSQHLHRKLGVKEVQLFALSAAIGTGIFVGIGKALPKAGPAGLLIGFLIWGTCMLAVNECYAEMVVYMPVHSATITFGSKWVDEAFGFAMGWNYFLNMALLVPFEIVAVSLMIGYWTDVMPAAAVVVIMMVIYLVLNVISVSWFGAAEFYMGFFKILLALALTAYTFVTMVGGNPKHDVYGFRYWNEPGPFMDFLLDGSTGRFLGVLAAIVQAGFNICGPEYLSMIAAETRDPRKVLKRAFGTFYIRIILFFVGAALCVGICIPSNDPTLAKVHDEGISTGAASPYVISMKNFGIAGLGSVVNAGILLSLISAGNGLLFCAARTLHGMAVEGKAPKFFSYCTKNGIPYAHLALIILIWIGTDSETQILGSHGVTVNLLVIMITANQLLNHFSVGLTYIFFYRAMKAQGVDRRTLPYVGRFQPYTSYLAVASMFIMTFLIGFDLFIDYPKNWDIKYFFLNYSMLGLYIVMFGGYKLLKRTKRVKAMEMDLALGESKNEIETHEMLLEEKPMGLAEKILLKVLPM